jgi:transposase
VSNVLSEEKRQQVIALGRLGWTLRRIEQATGVRRETAGRYLRAAGVAVRPSGGWGRQPPAKPAIEVSTDPAPATALQTTDPAPETAKAANETSTDSFAPSAGEHAPGRSPTASACEPCREIIQSALAHGCNAMAIWQDLVDTSGFAAGYSSVKRFVVKLRGPASPEACGIIETAPGEEGQVDYGTGPMVRDPGSGKYRRTRLFVFTLGYSRQCVRLLVFASSSRVWAELHEKAFARLGGVPRIVVLDNLREGVLAPDIYDPTINLLYRDMLAHYDIVAMPCRVRDPDRKARWNPA